MITMRGFPADVEYSVSGDGPALLLLPGNPGTSPGWRAVTDRLTRSHRIATTSLLGYGATAERRPLGNATMRQQTEVIDRIDVATLVVRGGDGHTAMMRIAGILAEVIPHSRLETVVGGSHFLPATNPAELANLLEVHLEAGST